MLEKPAVIVGSLKYSHLRIIAPQLLLKLQ
jgi:hypothetical protein